MSAWHAVSIVFAGSVLLGAQETANEWTCGVGAMRGGSSKQFEPKTSPVSNVAKLERSNVTVTGGLALEQVAPAVDRALAASSACAVHGDASATAYVMIDASGETETLSIVSSALGDSARDCVRAHLSKVSYPAVASKKTFVELVFVTKLH